MFANLTINFNGTGNEAISLYQEVFGLENVEVLKYGDLPPNPGFELSAEEKGYVFSAMLSIGGLSIMVQDLVKAMQSPFKSNITISVLAKDRETVTRWFEAMANGGTISCPLQAMPWASWYGAVTDRFGTPWQFQCE